MNLCEGHGAAVKPTVHDFGNAAHNLPAFRALDMDFVHVRSVQFDGFIDIFNGFFHQFRPGTDALQMAAAFTSPDVDRSTPIPVAGNCPIVDVFKPVSEALLPHKGREPVHFVIVLNQLILQLGHFDIPAGFGVINQRRGASPAMRIVVLNFCLAVDFVFGGQPFNDVHIETVFHYETTGPRSLHVFSLFIHRIGNGKIVLSAGIIVIFSKSRSRMNDTGTVLRGDIIAAGNIKGFLIHFNKGHQLFILNILQILAFHFFKHRIGAGSQNLISQGFADIIYRPLLFHFQVIDIRTDSKGNVGCQRPRCGCPCQEIFVLIFPLELYGYGVALNLFVT